MLPKASRALERFTVLDLTRVRSGPTCVRQLADWGANVIKVEVPEHLEAGDPPGGPREGPDFQNLHRNKRGITLDLKSSSGREVFLRLAAKADVVVENFRPDVKTRLGIDYPTLSKINPRLVYASISGFGQDGPYRDRPGHDLNYAALTGILAETTPEGTMPFPPPVALGDLTAGLLAVQAVLLGVLKQRAGGRGGHLDVSMFDGLVSLLTAHLGPVLNGSGPRGVPYEPGYDVFRTRDGLLLSIGVAHEDHFWRALCDVLDLPAERALVAPQRFADQDRLSELIRSRIAERDRAEWDALLTAHDIPYAAVNDLPETVRDAHVEARGLLVSVPGGEGQGPEWHVRQPLVIDGHAPGPTRQAPELGEHTREVLLEYGLPADVVQGLFEAGVAHE
jgi:crotonobetainyl-CoA:carnitine CoA-transferase CaiB-like acyl-CoA transferase